MKNINLIPRKPVIEQFFILLLFSVALFTALAAFAVLFGGNAVESRLQAAQKQIAGSQARIRQLSAALQPDPLAQTFNTFSAQIVELKKNRRNWLPVLKTVSANLPDGSRIISISSESDTLSLNMEFSDISDIADYMIRTQQSPLVDRLSVKSISRSDRAVTVTGQKAIGPAATPASSPSSTQTGEDLLNQLQQIVSSKLSQPAAASTPAAKPEMRKGSPTSASLVVFSTSLEIELKPLAQTK